MDADTAVAAAVAVGVVVDLHYCRRSPLRCWIFATKAAEKMKKTFVGN